MEEKTFNVNIITQMTGELKEMTVREIVNYLDEQSNYIEKIEIKKVEKNSTNNILKDDLEYLIIENEETDETVVKITQYDVKQSEGYLVKIKPKKE